MATSTARVMPGFSLCLGYSVTYLSLLVLAPLSALLYKSIEPCRCMSSWAVVWTKLGPRSA